MKRTAHLAAGQRKVLGGKCRSSLVERRAVHCLPRVGCRSAGHGIRVRDSGADSGISNDEWSYAVDLRIDIICRIRCKKAGVVIRVAAVDDDVLAGYRIWGRDGSGNVQLAADLLPDALLKGGRVDQLVDDFLHRAVDDFLAPLVMIVAALAVHMQAVLAGVVEVVAVIGSVALFLAVHVAVHAAAADGALEQPGQDVLVVKAVCLELALVGLLALLLRKLPVFLGNDGLVNAVVERIVLLIDDVVLVAGAGDSEPIGCGLVEILLPLLPVRHQHREKGVKLPGVVGVNQMAKLVHDDIFNVGAYQDLEQNSWFDL